MKKPVWSVVSVEPRQGYQLLIQFADGKHKLYDVKPLLRCPLYASLKNPDVFKRAEVKYGTVVWSDEIDIAPENLYEEGRPVA